MELHQVLLVKFTLTRQRGDGSRIPTPIDGNSRGPEALPPLATHQAVVSADAYPKTPGQLFDRFCLVPDTLVPCGLNDVPRGTIGHWVRIKDKKIENYQYVVPSTWNLAPRDAKGQKSPVEESLIGTPIADARQPLEVLRTVHSFDPCLGCACGQILTGRQRPPACPLFGKG